MHQDKINHVMLYRLPSTFCDSTVERFFLRFRVHIMHIDVGCRGEIFETFPYDKNDVISKKTPSINKSLPLISFG